MSEKKFGLVIPRKADKFKMRTNPLFDDESDDEKKRRRPKIPQKKFDFKTKIKQESVDDPSIYEYDSIYDDMKAKEAESIAPKEKKSSRYIETLLKAAEKRKKEYERRVDKKIQAEREKEGDLYKDKEAFVTSSYKKKLQENEEEEEREHRENMLNDMMDITKQKDLSGFYRHFLKQTVGEEKIPVFGEKHIKQEVTIIKDDNSNKGIENVKDNNYFDYTSIDQDSDGIEIDSDSDNKISNISEKTSSKKRNIENTTQRYNDTEEESQRSKVKKHSVFRDKLKYLQQRKKLKTDSEKTNNISDSDSEASNKGDVMHSKAGFHSNKYRSKETFVHHSRRNLSSDDNEASKNSDKLIRKDNSIKTNIYAKHTVGDNKKNSNTSDSDSESSDNEDVICSKKGFHSDKYRSIETSIHHSRHDSSSDDNEVNKKSDKVIEKDNSIKINIYAKRTVDDIFIAAQTRYFQRMGLKNKS